MIYVEHLNKSDYSKKMICQFLKEVDSLFIDPFSNHVVLEDYSKKINDLGDVFVAFNGNDNVFNNMIGIIFGYMNNYELREAYIQGFVVRKEYQNRGCGKILLNAFNEEVKNRYENGKIYLTVDKENAKARSFYKNNGFVESGRVHSNSKKMVLEKVV